MAEGALQRDSRRVPVDIEASYSFSGKWYPCVLHDLTTGGAGLKINQFFVVGDTIRMRLTLEGDERELAAEVANVSGNRIGVKFLTDPETVGFLKAVIKAHK